MDCHEHERNVPRASSLKINGADFTLLRGDLRQPSGEGLFDTARSRPPPQTHDAASAAVIISPGSHDGQKTMSRRHRQQWKFSQTSTPILHCIGVSNADRLRITEIYRRRSRGHRYACITD